MWNKVLKSNKGFTLLEVIIAIFIISVGVGGVATIVPRLLSGSAASQNSLIAAYLAQEGVEIVRNIRDTNWLENRYGSPVTWDEGFAPCASGCEADYTSVTDLQPALTLYGAEGHYLNMDSGGLYSYDAGTQTKFKRKIIVQVAGDILTITVNVFWEDRGKFYNFPVQEKLYKWY